MDEYHKELCRKKLIEYEKKMLKFDGCLRPYPKMQYNKGFYAGFNEAFEILSKGKPELFN